MGLSSLTASTGWGQEQARQRPGCHLLTHPGGCALVGDSRRPQAAAWPPAQPFGRRTPGTCPGPRGAARASLASLGRRLEEAPGPEGAARCGACLLPPPSAPPAPRPLPRRRSSGDPGKAGQGLPPCLCPSPRGRGGFLGCTRAGARGRLGHTLRFAPSLPMGGVRGVRRQRRPGCGILLDFAISLFCDFLLLVCFLAVTCCGFCSASVELLCFAESG